MRTCAWSTVPSGREIFARIDRQGPPAFTPAWFDDKLVIDQTGVQSETFEITAMVQPLLATDPEHNKKRDVRDQQVRSNVAAIVWDWIDFHFRLLLCFL